MNKSNDINHSNDVKQSNVEKNDPNILNISTTAQEWFNGAFNELSIDYDNIYSKLNDEANMKRKSLYIA